MATQEGILNRHRWRAWSRADAAGVASSTFPGALGALGVVLLAYLAAMEGLWTAVSWAMAGGGLLVASRALMRAMPEAPLRLAIPAGAYLLLSLVGLGLVEIYRHLYQMDFGPWSDDSYYYMQMLDIARSRRVDAYTLYEWVGAGWCFALEFLSGRQASLMMVLPMNWALGAFSVLLASALAWQVTAHRCPTWLLLAALLGNYVYTDAFAHLYRDALMVPLMLGALLFASRGMWIPALGSGVLCGMVRGGNGAIALTGVGFFAIARSSRARQRPALVLVLCVLAIVGAVLMDEFVHYGRYMRTIGKPSEVSDETLLELSMKRSGDILGGRQELFSQAAEQGDDSMRALYALGPIGGAFRPAVTVFAPFKVPPMVGETRVRVLQQRVFYVEGLLPQFWLQSLTVALWVFVGPVLILGLVRAARGKLELRLLLLLWALAVVGVAFASFQHRHRCAFVVLAPVFLALTQSPWSRKEEQAWSVLTLLFLIGLIVRNAGAVI